jgi:hypothetical protein
MSKTENVFEEEWSKLLEMYKKDWKYTLRSYRKEGKSALKYLPKHFYSEADIEITLSYMLRNRLKKETYFNSEYVVRDQLRFSSNAYTGFKISDRIEKMETILKNEKIGKKKFIPDIVIDNLSNANEGAFLLFAELTYLPGSSTKYNKGVPKKIDDLIEKVEEEAKTLNIAKKAEVLESGYVCIISDDLVSIDGAIKGIQKLEKEYPEVKFLYDGMKLTEKYKTLGLPY